MLQYWAHSAPVTESDPGSRRGWQPLSDHLESVGAFARGLALAARPEDVNFADIAYFAGLLHDFGKYSNCFQKMLQTGRGRCQHAIHGAMLAYFGAKTFARVNGLLTVAFAIAGHHAGLPNGGDLGGKLREQKFRAEVDAIFTRACNDSEVLNQVVTHRLSDQLDIAPRPAGARLDLAVRMLFSCLVDADRLDSAGRKPIQESLQPKDRLNVLLERLAKLQDRSPDGPVKQMRSQVLQDCLNAASSSQKLFSLSVPTGGGKTLAAMAFALRRAALFPQQFRRVIVVIPYLSIIEQNAQVYADIFGRDELLEHHSGSFVKLKKDNEEHFSQVEDEQEEEHFQETGLRSETENWDAPLIVTTSVRFFESLFSNRPADLRRVHNIARSIVILDEVQTLPRRLLGPLLAMMKELSEDWGVNFVFSTATQPAFERPPSKNDLRWEPGTLTEIVQAPEPLRASLKRAEICWEIDRPVDWPEVADRMMKARQCLAIVNVRDHAGALYEEVLRIAEERDRPEEGIFHLSTRMCAAHRLRVLGKIRERLRANELCYVVSTQLVEAGVDLDFPLVLRAIGPLDSIVQAAGRADREGKRTALLGHPGGEVVVFLPEENRMPPNEYREAAGVTEAIAKAALLDGAGIQVDSAKAIQEYFELYYGGDRDLGQKLEMELRRREKFRTLAEEFEMISSRTRDVFVPDDEEARRAIARLRDRGELTLDLRRALQRHVIGLSPWEFDKAKGVLERLPGEGEIWIAHDHAYDPKLGLLFEVAVEKLIL